MNFDDNFIEGNILTPSERTANFNQNEIAKLKELINKYSKIILNKQTNGQIVKQKEEAWNLITNEFNSLNSTFRSCKQLKCKWEYMKKNARKEAGKNNRQRRMTGGGPPPPPLSETNEWVAGVLKESATGLSSLFDGDATTSVELEVIDSSVPEIIKPDVPVISTESEDKYETPVKKKILRNGVINFSTPQETRHSFMELAKKKKEYVEVKKDREENITKLKEEKIRLEMDLMKKMFENEEKRKDELHELQLQKLRLEIVNLQNKNSI